MDDGPVRNFLQFSNKAPLSICEIFGRYGRKTTLLCGALPITIGWVVMLCATSVEYLYAARVLWGMTHGAVQSVVLPMYLGEIGSDKIRGSISTILGIMAKSGNFLVYAIGPHVSIYTLGWMGISLPILFVGTFIWLPESPHYFLGKNRQDDAMKSLQRLRGHDNVIDEMKSIANMVRMSSESNEGFREILKSGNRRGLIIVTGLAAATILVGTEAMLSFSQLIFDEVGGIGLEGSTVNMIFGALLVGTTVLATFAVDRFGRRPLLLSSTVGFTVCNFTIAIFFLLIRMEVNVNGVSWIPIVACMVYIFCYGMSLATVSFAVMGEILPKHMKAIAGVIFGLTTSLLSLVVNKLFQVIADNLGYHVTFFCFAFFACLFFPFVYFVIPETKGKSLDAILKELNNSK